MANGDPRNPGGSAWPKSRGDPLGEGWEVVLRRWEKLRPQWDSGWPRTLVHVQTQGVCRCPRVSMHSLGSWLLHSPESLKAVIPSAAVAFRPSAF